MAASVILSSHFLTNHLHFVLYCVWEHPRAVLVWRLPPPGRTLRDDRTEPGEVTLHGKLGHAAPQQKSCP